MRQWLVNPRLMCRKHLLGEHVEHHMFVGTLNKGISIKGYLEKGLLETHSLIKRHNELVKEMKKRGFNHNSPLPKFQKVRKGKINVSENLKELRKRCEECRRLQDDK